MPRVNYVKHARARFEMVDKTDEQGNVVQVPVTRKDGSPKTTKSGRPVVRTLSVQDRTKPLPNYKCGSCGKEIMPGMPYKWIEPKTRGLMTRCMDCPTWQPWEYSSSLSARIAEIQHNAQSALDADFADESEFTSILEEIAGEIRSLADEKEEAASNMEEGFGHSTYQSDELNDQAEQLNDWAQEIEDVTCPDMPESGEVECENQFHSEEDQEGEIDDDLCPDCGGDHANPQMVESDEVDDDTLEEWRNEARQAAQDAIDNCPL